MSNYPPGTESDPHAPWNWDAVCGDCRRFGKAPDAWSRVPFGYCVANNDWVRADCEACRAHYQPRREPEMTYEEYRELIRLNAPHTGLEG